MLNGLAGIDTDVPVAAVVPGSTQRPVVANRCLDIACCVDQASLATGLVDLAVAVVAAVAPAAARCSVLVQEVVGHVVVMKVVVASALVHKTLARLERVEVFDHAPPESKSEMGPVQA